MKKLIDKLEALFQLDVDAVRAYKQAIEQIDVLFIREQLQDFQRDHVRHIDDLSAAIASLGGDVPNRSPDVKGFILEGFTAIRSMTGVEGALKAMKTNEELTNKRYDSALEDSDMPGDILALLEKNRADERRHLAYIETTLDQRTWEHGGMGMGR